MNQRCNEKPIDFDFSHPLPFSSLFFPLLSWERSVFRIEFIVWDAFSTKGHWLVIVDSRPPPSSVGDKQVISEKADAMIFH